MIKWTSQKPDRSCFTWWLPGPVPFLVLVRRDARLIVFGDGKDVRRYIYTAAGLWAFPVMPDGDMDIVTPNGAGYWWWQGDIKDPPIAVSVAQPKAGEPVVYMMGVVDPVPLSKLTGRWSTTPILPPAEIEWRKEG